MRSPRVPVYVLIIVPPTPVWAVSDSCTGPKLLSSAPAVISTTALVMVSRCVTSVRCSLSTSVMVMSLSTTATSAPRGRNVVMKSLPAAVLELLASRSSRGASLRCVMVIDAVSPSRENAVEPPRLPLTTLTLFPSVPVY